MLVVGDIEPDRVAPVLFRPQLLPLAAQIVADDAVGRVKDVAGAAVVLFQTDDPGVFILGLEGEDVFDRRPAELVDALVVVAHDADIARAAREERGEQILQVIRVLILVDQHVTEAALPVTAYLLVLLQEPDRIGDQIVEIHRAGGEQAAHILHIDLSDADAADVAAIARPAEVFLRVDLRVLRAADLAEKHRRREALFIQIQILDDALHQALDVARVVDRKARGEAEPLRLAAQDAHAGRVEGAGPDVAALLAEHPRQALLQLARGLVGEGDREDAPGLNGIQARRGQAALAALLQGGQHGLVGALRQLVAVAGAAVLEEIGDAVDEHRQVL